MSPDIPSQTVLLTSLKTLLEHSDGLWKLIRESLDIDSTALARGSLHTLSVFGGCDIDWSPDHITTCRSLNTRPFKTASVTVHKDGWLEGFSSRYLSILVMLPRGRFLAGSEAGPHCRWATLCSLVASSPRESFAGCQRSLNDCSPCCQRRR